MDSKRVTKEEYFKYLNDHKSTFWDMQSTNIIMCMMQHFNRKYSSCAKYYLLWKQEVLKIPSNTFRTKQCFEMETPRFKKSGDCLVGENGEYSEEDGGLLLTNGKAYLKFKDKNDFLRFFHECQCAMERLGVL